MQSNSISIIITGDLVINSTLYREKIDENLIKLFSNSDLNVANLECPVTEADDSAKIIKTGPHLKGDGNSIQRVLKRLNIRLVTLANNHIFDFGERGIRNTLSFCAENEVETVGAGENLEMASRVFRKMIAGRRISFINFAENEWASATQASAGSNPMDIIENINQIRSEKTKSDIVIVIIHGGHEYYNLPSPRMQKQYRFYADNGADLIVGHHSHCISGNEIYNGVPIYYSLGNFLFTHESEYPEWYQGLALEVNIDANLTVRTKLHAIQQERQTYSLELLDIEKGGAVLKKISELNKIIGNDKALIDSWEQYILKTESEFLRLWSPMSFIKSQFLKKVFSKLNIRFFNKYGFALYLNLMRCEAHRDLSKDIIDRYIHGKSN